MSVSIFFCYAHEDEELRKGIEKQLKALKRQGLIDIWHDRDIKAGTEWEREIDKHLNSAQIILLLVSPDFMNSDYCYSKELVRAMERHERGEARVIPVILRPVYWHDSPFGRLQALPTDAKAIKSRYWRNLDEAFFNIAEGIRKAIQKFTSSTTSPDLTTEETSKSKPVEPAPTIKPKEFILISNLVQETKRPSTVATVAFSPINTQLLVSCTGHIIQVWDLRTAHLVRRLTGHAGSIESVIFSPDGKTVVSSGGYDHTIKIWDFLTGEVLHELVNTTDWINCVAFSPDGQMVASGGNDGTIKLWNPYTEELLHTLEGHSHSKFREIHSIAFSPDGQMVASGGLDKTIKLWNPHKEELLRSMEHADTTTTWVKCVAFSPDGQILASGSSGCTVKLWNPYTGELLRNIPAHSDGVRALAFSPDGQILASGSDDTMIKLWNPRTGRLLQTLEGHKSWIFGLAFSPDGQILASAGGNREETIKIWGMK